MAETTSDNLDFDLIFGTNSPLKTYHWSTADYKEGWETSGNNPPSKQQFDALQRVADLKLQRMNNIVNALDLGDFVRTVDDGNKPLADTATLALLMDGLANRIKAITGGDTWRAEPAITLAKTDAQIDALTATDASLQGQIDTAVKYAFIQRETAYAVGEVVYSTNLAKGLRLYCMTAGTTAETSPDFANATADTQVTDGDVTWVVESVNDMIPVGDIVFRPFLKTGYVKANGATVNRADYPRLVQFATDNALWGDAVYQFGTGDGSTTMVLPNYQDRFIEGGSSPAVLSAGLPNATGQFNTETCYKGNTPSGVFHVTSEGTSPFTTGSAENYRYRYISFSLANSNAIYGNSSTVQPPAIKLIPQIKY